MNRKPHNSDIELDSLFDYFKDITSTEHDDVDDSEEELGVPNFNSDLLYIEVTEDEIMNCVKKLKSGKCLGTDKIINEYIKISCPLLLPIYVNLFNMILDTGNLPESWLIGAIKPLYKNKGDPALPENDRPITILSCMSKLFTAMLHTRPNTFLEDNTILIERWIEISNNLTF